MRTLEKISNAHDIDLNEIMVENLSAFINQQITNCKHSTIEAKHTIAQASLGSEKSMNSKIRNTLKTRSKIFQKVISSDVKLSSHYSIVKPQD